MKIEDKEIKFSDYPLRIDVKIKEDLSPEILLKSKKRYSFGNFLN